MNDETMEERAKAAEYNFGVEHEARKEAEAELEKAKNALCGENLEEACFLQDEHMVVVNERDEAREECDRLKSRENMELKAALKAGLTLAEKYGPVMEAARRVRKACKENPDERIVVGIARHLHTLNEAVDALEETVTNE